MSMGRAERTRFGDLLLEMRLVDEATLASALDERRSTGRRLTRILGERRLVDEERLVKAVGAKLGLETVNLDSVRIHPRVLARIPPDVAKAHGMLPYAVKRTSGAEVLYLVMSDPLDGVALAEAQRRSGCQIRVMLAAASSLEQAIEAHYGRLSVGTPVSPPRPVSRPTSRPSVVLEESPLAKESTPVSPRDKKGFGRESTIVDVPRAPLESSGSPQLPPFLPPHEAGTSMSWDLAAETFERRPSATISAASDDCDDREAGASFNDGRTDEAIDVGQALGALPRGTPLEDRPTEDVEQVWSGSDSAFGAASERTLVDGEAEDSVGLATEPGRADGPSRFDMASTFAAEVTERPRPAEAGRTFEHLLGEGGPEPDRTRYHDIPQTEDERREGDGRTSMGSVLPNGLQPESGSARPEAPEGETPFLLEVPIDFEDISHPFLFPRPEEIPIGLGETGIIPEAGVVTEPFEPPLPDLFPTDPEARRSLLAGDIPMSAEQVAARAAEPAEAETFSDDIEQIEEVPLDPLDGIDADGLEIEDVADVPSPGDPEDSDVRAALAGAAAPRTPTPSPSILPAPSPKSSRPDPFAEPEVVAKMDAGAVGPEVLAPGRPAPRPRSVAAVHAATDAGTVGAAGSSTAKPGKARAEQLVQALEEGSSLNSADRIQLVLALGRALLASGVLPRELLIQELED